MTVTALSKTLAAFLFIALPFIGFYAGLQYQKTARPPSAADPGASISFHYPEKVPATYITAAAWPPRVQDLHTPFSCAEKKILVQGREYCVVTTTEGAAGSLYTAYTYAFPRDDTTVALTFSLRFTQCGNYEAAQKSECERERASFNVDEFADRMAQSVVAW